MAWSLLSSTSKITNPPLLVRSIRTPSPSAASRVVALECSSRISRNEEPECGSLDRIAVIASSSVHFDFDTEPELVEGACADDALEAKARRTASLETKDRKRLMNKSLGRIPDPAKHLQQSPATNFEKCRFHLLDAQSTQFESAERSPLVLGPQATKERMENPASGT